MHIKHIMIIVRSSSRFSITMKIKMYEINNFFIRFVLKLKQFAKGMAASIIILNN